MTNAKAQRLAHGPQGLEFLNALINFYRDPINLFAGLHKQYGNIVRLQGLGYCAHLITQPEHVKYVLQDNAKNYQLSGIFNETTPVVGKGLTTNNGASWLKQRRMVQYAFQHRHIPAYANIIMSYTEDELNQWCENIDQSLNIDAEILKINLLILGKLLFSVAFKPDDPFLKALAIVRKATIDHARSIIKLPKGPRFQRALRYLDNFAYGKIDERRRGNPYRDILSTMMEATILQTETRMNNTELRDEIMTLFFAAYEDVANALAWTWYLLAQNPHIEANLRKEIQNMLGERPPTAADLTDLPYLTMTVNEVLRFYPTTWSLLRDSIGEDEIGGFHIPAGSMIIFDLYLTHRLPEYWQNPERFDPEHFSSEQSADRPRFAYFPFGGGPRQCIGNELALMQIKLILIRMIQRFRFTLVSKTPIQMNPLSSLQPRGGVWMKIKKV